MKSAFKKELPYVVCKSVDIFSTGIRIWEIWSFSVCRAGIMPNGKNWIEFPACLLVAMVFFSEHPAIKYSVVLLELSTQVQNQSLRQHEMLKIALVYCVGYIIYIFFFNKKQTKTIHRFLFIVLSMSNCSKVISVYAVCKHCSSIILGLSLKSYVSMTDVW